MTNNQYDIVCFECSKLVTNHYSTSFSKAISLFPTDIKVAICNIYGFVRFADEIVDSFHDYPKKELLDNFVEDLNDAMFKGISLNPILHSFAKTVQQYQIEKEQINAFLSSMYLDLGEINYKKKEDYDAYIYGSAEVVGLMCLKVFVNGNQEMYNQLKPYAQSFGSALQKINFLRDIKADYCDLNRTYFPNVDFNHFSSEEKMEIENDITNDFLLAKKGIDMLPLNCKFAVLLAYKYYINLFHKIKNTKSDDLMKKRIRVSNPKKIILLLGVILQKKLNYK